MARSSMARCAGAQACCRSLSALWRASIRVARALDRTGSSMTGSWAHDGGEDHPKHKVIGAISIAELRDRILTHLDSSPDELTVDAMLEQPLQRSDDEMIAEF